MTTLPHLLTTHTPTISKSGSDVTIACEDPDVATAIFEALMVMHSPHPIVAGLWGAVPSEWKKAEDYRGCTCAACYPAYPFFRVCTTCGNKRCPHAQDHRFVCRGSNEPGQIGVLAEDADADPL